MEEHNNSFDPTKIPENPYKYETESKPATPAPMPVYHTEPCPVYENSVPVHRDESKMRSSAIKSMVFGIVSMEVPFVGIVFGAIAKGIGKHILRANPQQNATRVFAKLGRIFGLIGFILNIVLVSIYSLAIFLSAIFSSV